MTSSHLAEAERLETIGITSAGVDSHYLGHLDELMLPPKHRVLASVKRWLGKETAVRVFEFDDAADHPNLIIKIPAEEKDDVEVGLENIDHNAVRTPQLEGAVAVALALVDKKEGHVNVRKSHIPRNVYDASKLFRPDPKKRNIVRISAAKIAA
jgi:hypothetical protein